jgi:hypothetical protein
VANAIPSSFSIAVVTTLSAMATSLFEIGRECEYL